MAVRWKTCMSHDLARMRGENRPVGLGSRTTAVGSPLQSGSFIAQMSLLRDPINHFFFLFSSLSPSPHPPPPLSPTHPCPSNPPQFDQHNQRQPDKVAVIYSTQHRCRWRGWGEHRDPQAHICGEAPTSLWHDSQLGRGGWNHIVSAACRPTRLSHSGA